MIKKAQWFYRFLLAVVIIVMIVSTAMRAKAGGLAVLHDSGRTLPLAPLAEASGLSAPPVASEPPPEFSRADIERMRAMVRSPGLTPGRQPRLPTGQAGAMLPRPLFLVGSDDYSLAWLRQFHDRLKELDAVGLIVHAESRADIRRVRAAAGGLTLAAGSGDALAEQFGIRHYPVLIGPEWIEQ